MSSLGADARLLERPLHTTSQPVDVANGTNVSEVANTRTVIQSFDAAKIRRKIKMHSRKTPIYANSDAN